ncbi:CocE/NonD family hydrolase [Halobacillus sp. H74]|uniref:CocE/NonD family hydrolase n=1 Tax=Halobacillus sp. H74 TaxID=3457436 RepID=UPI003FCEAB15
MKAIIVEKDVACEVSDGTTLFANVYRPSEEGTFPVLLTRLPYDKNLPEFSHRFIDPIRIAREGYIVIIQDVRGRFTSEGNFHPFLQEKQDGYDTVEWAARLPYSNGKIGMFGLSYYGFTQLYAAVEKPPSLKALFPVMTGSELDDGLIYRGGALELGLFATWLLESIAPDYLSKAGRTPEEVQLLEKALEEVLELFEHSALKEWSSLFQCEPALEELFNEYRKEETLIEASISSQLEEIDLPAYHMAGCDCFLGPTLRNYQLMKQVNPNQRLIIGPWAHGDFSSVIGERSFGRHSAGSSIEGRDDLTSLHIAWFDFWLKGKNHPLFDEKPVKIFVMGMNEWRGEEEWPLKRSRYTPFYLSGNGNSNLQEGRLYGDISLVDACDRFVYDPENPVPTHGGGTLFYQGRNVGPRIHQPSQTREDVLVYATDPLREKVEVTGEIKVCLWVSSEAASTDFTAKLLDVAPDGTAFNLTDGVFRIPHIEKEPMRIEIDLWATSNVFLTGHSIQIEVSSSNFPRYDVNPNTGGTLSDTTHTKKVIQTIHQGKDYPSHILLPIIPDN